VIHVLAVAHFCKGERLLKTFKELGCHVVLLSRAALQDKPWPRHLVDEIFFVKDFRNRRDVLNAVSYLHQDRDFQIVAPMDEYAVSPCATIRAHLACPGLCEGTTRKVRDKLAMRCVARANNIPVPDFCGFSNKEQIGKLLHSTQAPWMVKPRAAGGSVRICKLWTHDEVWRLYDQLGDARAHHIIEEFVPSDVYHVDTVVHKGKILLEVPGRYATPPFDVWHGGGVFAAQTVPRKSRLGKGLLQLNKQVIEAMGIRNGVNHAEFLGRGNDLYFLEIAARVPGSNLDQLSTAATGVDLFAESAKIQFSRVSSSPYTLGKFRYKEAGIVQCLAQQEHPPLGAIAELPELTWSWSKEHHVGAAFASPSHERVEELTEQILQQFREEHLAVLPASESPA
jgi:biotin carboxylase